jgi:spermidine synthase
MKYIKTFSLPLVVFLTGACVLVIEIVATRILSPYYGNTIFTVSSVIGIVLAALSVGYYFGGKLADKYPTEKIFYSIILTSGLSIVILYFLILFLLPVIGYRLSITTGPLISAILLFFSPSLLLGTLSPFAIKLQERYFPKKGIGSITGEIFFWSTLGSIFGSLFSGFVLIPRFGINQIVLSVAVVLIILGLFPLIKIGMRKKSIFKIILLIVVGGFLVSTASQLRKNNLVYSHDGVYEKITIYDANYAGKPTRFFKQDRSGSGAMFLASNELVFDYTKYYALYKIFKPDIGRALVIGGGAYSIPKALLKDLPNATVDISEIEPSLYELAQKYFGVNETGRLNNYVDDGRRLLHDTDTSYDLIFSDVYYSLFSIPAHFTTQEFFKIAKDRLNDDGIFIANLIGDLSRQESSLIMSEIKTFQSVFPNSYFFAVDSPSKIGSQNIIFVGYNSNKKIDFADPKITEDNDPIIRSLGEKSINLDRFEFSKYPILTDNFSPVEYLTSRVLQKSFGQQKLIDGNEILALINQQLQYGPRYLSAPGHENVQKFLIAEMNALAQETKIQTWQHTGPDGQKYELTNIIGRLYPTNEKRIILSTHYDSKKLADRDSENQNQPVPGANDSASGVAVLLELTRILANSNISPDIGIDIVFFDGEEGEENQGGDYTNWKPLGSTYFAEHLGEVYVDKKPIGGVVLDLVCDKDLKILKEQSSVQNASSQTKNFWDIAKRINNNIFVDKIGLEIRDDHTPLNQAGIPSFLVIDSEYPPFHTTNDTVDKCSAESLETVANAVLNYVYAVKK